MTVPCFGEAGEVADVVALLASSRAGYITGRMLILDGALHWAMI